jgi:hyperosmotically inducible periplasmic protein
MKRLTYSAMFSVGLLLLCSACSQKEKEQTETTTTSATQDAKETTTSATDSAKDSASNAADSTKNAMSSAADKTKDAAADAGQAMKEGGLTAKVKSKLAADVKLSTLTTIDVDSNGNTVTLTGTVPTAADRVAAGKTAISVDGVKHVVNHLKVSQ